MICLFCFEMLYYFACELFGKWEHRAQFLIGNGNYCWFGFFETDDTWSSFFLHRDWDILIMDALLHVPGNEERHRTFRINLADNPLSCTACTESAPHPSENSKANLTSNQ